MCTFLCRLRQAWCELRGGHEDIVRRRINWKGDGIGVRMICSRCDRMTAWHPVPTILKPHPKD
jgi:hypothetical protein